MKTNTEPLLTLNGVSKHFGGVSALQDIDIEVFPGEIHALAGENGAGKSTLGKLLLGVHAPSSGEMRLNGNQITLNSPAEGNANGLVGIAQELSLMPTRTVAENIALGIEITRFGIVNESATRVMVSDIMDRYGMHLDLDLRVSQLSVAQQQKVETLRALARDAQLIVFDEPTARLASNEVEHLLELVQALARSGKAIIYVTHFLDEMLQISDRITILRNGQKVRSSAAGQETRASLIEGITGRVAGVTFPERHAFDGDAAPLLEVDGLSLPGRFEDVSLSIRPGEIVGIAGLVGAGRSELGHAIYGASAPTKGEVRLNGQNVKTSGVAGHIAKGMALIPESRRDQGLMMDRAIGENVSLPHLRALSRWTGLDRKTEAARTRTECDKARVKHGGLDQPVSTLSGGNQQKVLFARTTMGAPQLLIADEPTRGVDVGAKQGIYEQITALAADGRGILLISSEIEEILGLCDRVYVMSRGRMTAELTGAELTEETVMHAAFEGH